MEEVLAQTQQLVSRSGQAGQSGQSTPAGVEAQAPGLPEEALPPGAAAL